MAKSFDLCFESQGSKTLPEVFGWMRTSCVTLIRSAEAVFVHGDGCTNLHLVVLMRNILDG